jgi:hypothetical protein
MLDVSTCKALQIAVGGYATNHVGKSPALWGTVFMSNELEEIAIAPNSQCESMRVAFRRSVRVGPAIAGNDVEDFGVTPDHFHVITR